MVKIIKRNGEVVPFNKDKIIVAINKAFIDVDGTLYETDTAEDIAFDIYTAALENPDHNLSVEEIQDAVEKYLMRSDRLDVARAYIRYRYKREAARQSKDTFFEAITKKLNGIGIENLNANMDENSFSGRIGSAASVMTKDHALNYQMSDLAKNRHENNEIYTHKLYCA